MRLLMLLVFVHYGFACKYGIIPQISICECCRIAFSDTWSNNWESCKSITKT